MVTTAATLAAPLLTPVQQDAVDLLGAPRGERPSFDPELRRRLRAQLEQALAPVADHLETNGLAPLTVTKRTLAAVHGCEVKFLADEADGFPGWNGATARGVVAHKAIELSMHVRGEAVPLTLVDEALARLTERDDSLADWLQRATETDRAELRGDANDRVAKFLECFPPLKPAWRPVAESSMRVDLCGERIVLRGKVDLTLGTPHGSSAGKVIIDLKTGGPAPEHLDDLRYYALLEALRLGVPPRRVASCYLDAGRFVPADITEAALDAAAARLVDGVIRLAELTSGASGGASAPPRARPGPPCRWCRLLEGCETGRAFVGETDD